MSRFLSMIVWGGISALFPIIIFFIGIHQGYFEALDIKIYYNAFFFAHFPLILYSVLTLVLGFLFIYPKRQHVVVVLYSVLMLGAMSTFVPSVAMDIGKRMFETKPFHIKKGRFLYRGVLQYESTYRYYLLDDEANRTIVFQKGAINEAY